MPTRNPSRLSPGPTKNPVTSSPTSSPTTCGNDTCEAFESIITCPLDCSNIIFVANEEGTSGASGVVFDLKASRDVAITSFDIYTDSTRNDAIEVYTRSGSYKGHEGNGTGWLLVYNKTVSQMGRLILTELGDFDEGVTIQGGSSQSFYIFSEHTIMYDKGSVEGEVFSSDDSLTLYEGKIAALSRDSRMDCISNLPATL